MKRKIAVLLIIGLLGILCLTACFPKHDKVKELLGTNELPTIPCAVDYVYNRKSLELCVGDNVYVFVGQVTDYIRTEHKDDYAYTFYKLQVLENLKGNLRTDIEIVLEKQGGIHKFGKSFQIMEGDTLPKVGNYYVFIVWATADHGLTSGGPNTNLPVKLTDGDYRADANYKKTLRALENQETPPITLKNYVSEYDVDYQA